MSVVDLPRRVLLSVSKPARYTGGEWNSVIKEDASKYIRFALCFPDTYEIGMSHLGMKILYHLLNEREDTFCERFFMPWTDMIEQMEKLAIPLFSLETRSSPEDFDIIGFSLQYEMCYTNVLHMLDMGNIPLFASDRNEKDPIVIAGGPCAFNIEPMAEFFDAVLIGESEEQLGSFVELYKDKKNSGMSKKEFLVSASRIPGVYVPSFYDIQYKEDHTIKSITPNIEGIPDKVRKAVVMDPDDSYYPTKPIVPNIEIVHDRVSLELFRGCIRGCRFCQAGFITRPVREKGPEKLLNTAIDCISSTGYEEIGLLSLSTGDYSHLNELAGKLLKETEDTNISLSLPSLRLDSFNEDMLEQASRSRKSGLTFAPEAGTQRLRDVINKNITDEELFSSMNIAFQGGRSSVKLYYMIGLPTETMEDIRGIPHTVRKIIEIYKGITSQTRKRKLEITVSAAVFVPKPFTPFQWEAQDEQETIERKKEELALSLRGKNIRFDPHVSLSSIWEAVLARGDRQLGKVIYKAFTEGCMFDAWDDKFDYGKYSRIMDEQGLSIGFYANRKRAYDEILPWEHIDCGVTKAFLINENKRAYEGKTTEDCRTKCTGCGAAIFGGGVCYDDK